LPPPEENPPALLSWLTRPRAHHALIAVALLLLTPALAVGMVLDDHVLALLARDDSGFAGFRENPLFLFSFTLGQEETNRALMDAGALLPWWSDPHHLNAFFRPLSSLTHLMDFALWPDSPLLMHLHSLLWFAALLGIVAHIYHRFYGYGVLVAGLAFAIFALDDAHGMTVAWIANRNALISATLALPALGAHHRFLSDGWSAGRYVGPMCFALGLCAGESALGVLGYLAAHGLVLDRAPLLRRALHLLPYALVLVLWRVFFGALGLGSAGSGAYHDPLAEPLGFASALLEHLPVLLSAQLGLPLADLFYWGAPEAQMLILALSVLTVLGFGIVGHVLLSSDPLARFFGLGMVLSACVVAASVPGERLLLLPGVGGAALVAALICKLLPRVVGAAEPSRAAALLLSALAGLHLLAAPLSLPVRAYLMKLVGEAIDAADAAIPSEPAIAERTVIVLAAPFDLLLSYVQVGRQARGEPRPAHLHWLASASSEVRVQRLDAHTLRVELAAGFLYSAMERHYRGDARALPQGATVELSEFSATVFSTTDDGRPRIVDFRFRRPLEDGQYLFLRYDRGRLRPTAPPAVGERVALPRGDVVETLLHQILRTIPSP